MLFLLVSIERRGRRKRKKKELFFKLGVQKKRDVSDMLIKLIFFSLFIFISPLVLNTFFYGKRRRGSVLLSFAFFLDRSHEIFSFFVKPRVTLNRKWSLHTRQRFLNVIKKQLAIAYSIWEVFDPVKDGNKMNAVLIAVCSNSKSQCKHNADKGRSYVLFRNYWYIFEKKIRANKIEK